MNDKKEIILERIAIALEKIAESMIVGRCLGSSIMPEIDQVSKEKEQDPNVALIGDKKVGDENPILAFLKDRGVMVKEYRPNEEENAFDRLSLFMGRNYSRIGRVYSKIKSNMNPPNICWVDLDEASNEELRDSNQFCKYLKQINMISEYNYEKKPKKRIMIRPIKKSEQRRFFEGEWLERYVKTEIARMIKKSNRPIKNDCLTNIVIELPAGGGEAELDVLYLIGNNILWFETKTGDYRESIYSYHERLKTIGFEDRCSFLVLTEKDDPGKFKSLTKTFKLQVLNIQQLPKLIGEFIEVS